MRNVPGHGKFESRSMAMKGVEGLYAAELAIAAINEAVKAGIISEQQKDDLTIFVGVQWLPEASYPNGNSTHKLLQNCRKTFDNQSI